MITNEFNYIFNYIFNYSERKANTLLTLWWSESQSFYLQEMSGSEHEEEPVASDGEGGDESIQARHRKELKALNAKIQALKKTVTKGDNKKKKAVMGEIDKLQTETEARQRKEMEDWARAHEEHDTEVEYIYILFHACVCMYISVCMYVCVFVYVCMYVCE